MARKEEVMGKMSWLAYLIETEDEQGLIEFLAGRGFKNPNLAAREFLKAGSEIKEDNAKKIKKATGLINRASVGIRDEK